MFSLSSTHAISGFGSVLAPTPARDAGTAHLDAVGRQFEQEPRVRRAAAVGDAIGTGLARMWAQVRLALRRRAAVAELSALDDRMLADIGLTRGQIRAAVVTAAGFGPDLPVGPGVTSSINDNVYTRAA